MWYITRASNQILLCFRFHIFVDQAQEGEKDFSILDDLPGSVPKVGFTSPNFPTPQYYKGKIKDLRYYPSAIYKDLADRGKFWLD